MYAICTALPPKIWRDKSAGHVGRAKVCYLIGSDPALITNCREPLAPYVPQCSIKCNLQTSVVSWRCQSDSFSGCVCLVKILRVNRALFLLIFSLPSFEMSVLPHNTHTQTLHPVYLLELASLFMVGRKHIWTLQECGCLCSEEIISCVLVPYQFLSTTNHHVYTSSLLGCVNILSVVRISSSSRCLGDEDGPLGVI